MPLRQFTSAVGLAVVALTLFAGAAFADNAIPVPPDVSVSGATATVSGPWTWQSRDEGCDPTDRYLGWAVDWGDPAAPGNPIGTTGIAVGTAQDNTVHSDGGCGTVQNGVTSGTWGPLSHTYSAPGTYHVCAVLYDIHAGDELTGGSHGLVAGGDKRNHDNSAENELAEEGEWDGRPCSEAAVVIPASAFGSGTPAGPSGGSGAGAPIGGTGAVPAPDGGGSTASASSIQSTVADLGQSVGRAIGSFASPAAAVVVLPFLFLALFGLVLLRNRRHAAPGVDAETN